MPFVVVFPVFKTVFLVSRKCVKNNINDKHLYVFLPISSLIPGYLCFDNDFDDRVFLLKRKSMLKRKGK